MLFFKIVPQAVDEGKALIIEGLHMNPGLHLEEMSKLNAFMVPASNLNPPLSPEPEEQRMDSNNTPFGTSWKKIHSETFRPLYIPIVVTTTAENHRLMSKEAIYRRGSRFFPSQTSTQGF